MRVQLSTLRGDGNVRHDWTFVNPRDGFDFVLDRYVRMEKGDKGRFKMAGRWERIDQRDNTIDAPPVHSGRQMKDMLLRAIAEKLKITEPDNDS